MKCQILDTGVASAAHNMQLDNGLLKKIASSESPILHLYEWEGKCATYGHFLDPNVFLHRDMVKQYHLQLAKRPTGGGLCFHLTDFAFSFIVPSTHPGYSVNTLENYAFVNRIIANVIQKVLHTKTAPSFFSQEVKPLKKYPFCMAKPTPYDVMVDGRKVGGAAQRRTKEGFLHQGTISIALPPKNYLLPLLKDPSIWDVMQQTSYLFLGSMGGRLDKNAARIAEEDRLFAESIQAIRQELRKLLIEEVREYC